MAKFEMQGVLETAQMWQRLAEQSESVAKEAVGAGAMILADEIAHNLEASIAKGARGREKSGYKLTGDLQRGLGVTKVLPNRTGGFNAKVGFDGYGSDGRPLPLIARAMESGTSKQEKRPFIRPAVASAESRVQEAMKNVIEKAIEKEQK